MNFKVSANKSSFIMKTSEYGPPSAIAFSLPSLLPQPIQIFLDSILQSVQKAKKNGNKETSVLVQPVQEPYQEGGSEELLWSTLKILSDIVEEAKEERWYRASLATSKYRDSGERVKGREFLHEIGFSEELCNAVLPLHVKLDLKLCMWESAKNQREILKVMKDKPDMEGKKEKQPPTRMDPEVLKPKPGDTPLQVELKNRVKMSTQWVKSNARRINRCIKAASELNQFYTGRVEMTESRRQANIRVLKENKFVDRLGMLAERDYINDDKVREWISTTQAFRKQLWKHHRSLERDLRLCLHILDVRKNEKATILKVTQVGKTTRNNTAGIMPIIPH